MALSVQQLIAEALALPETSRALLAEQLFESLDKDDDAPISQEWQDEIARRCAEIDAGTATMIPVEEVFARLRARFE